MNGFIDYSKAREVAEAVYSDASSIIIPDGFVLDEDFNSGDTPGYLVRDSGLYVYALVSTTDPNVRVLAFRGTETTDAMAYIQDFIGDLQDIGKGQFGTGSSVINTWLAEKLTDPVNKIEIVGHSLGGALAQWTINDTNLTALAGLSGLTTTELASNLHFTTFNAPGITNAPGAGPTDKTSLVSGEHHVIEGFASFVHGDPVHLVGGAPVGGNVVAHIVDFRSLGQWGFGAHDIKNVAWWNSPIDPGYAPNYPDFQTAQTIASALSRLGNTNGTIDSETEAAFSMYLYLLAAFPAVV